MSKKQTVENFKIKLNVLSTLFPNVNSLDNLDVGKIYSTTNYEIIKHLSGNRGSKTGYVTKRVNNIIKMIESGEFMMGVYHVLINLNGDAIDGNNRSRALELCGIPINFMITAEERFNSGTDSDILNEVSEYNKINSSWADTDAYLSALEYKESTAMAIFNVKNTIAATYSAKINNQFTPSRFVIIATKNKKGLTSAKQTRKTYCSKSIAKTIETKEYQKVLDFICNVLVFVDATNPSVTPWRVVAKLMPYVWGYDLNLNKVLKNLKKRGFLNMVDTKMNGIEIRVKEIVMMGNIK